MKFTNSGAVKLCCSHGGSLATLLIVGALGTPAVAGVPGEAPAAFPRPLDTYGDAQLTAIAEILAARVSAEPFNLLATLIFLYAITHTFMASRFMAISHDRERAHQVKIQRGEAREGSMDSFAGIWHFLGEVEGVFGLWVIPLLLIFVSLYDWSTMWTSHGFVDTTMLKSEPSGGVYEQQAISGGVPG